MGISYLITTNFKYQNFPALTIPKTEVPPAREELKHDPALPMLTTGLLLVEYLLRPSSLGLSTSGTPLQLELTHFFFFFLASIQGSFHQPPLAPSPAMHQTRIVS